MMPGSGNEQVESIVCPICNSRNVRSAFAAMDRNHRVDRQIFKILRCSGCGLGFTIPKLPYEELARYYPDEYYSLDENRQVEASIESRRFRLDRIKQIKKFAPTGALIDIGSGTGMFLKTAREHGYDAEGLEISGSAAAYGKQTWGLNIRQGDLHGTAFQPNQFDVVTLWHVFEHLHDPMVAARQLFELTKPGGLMVIAVPNFRSAQARLFRGHWFHLDVPRHLFHYTPESLRILLESVGFKTMEIRLFSREHNWAGILGSVMRLHPPKESVIHKTARKTIGAYVSRSLAYIEAAAGQGGTFELYARK